eukprot:scpid80840/ scgid24599/ 
MGRTTRGSIADKENTPLVERKTRLRSGKTPLAASVPRKALGDINSNIASSPRVLTPAKKAVKRKAAEKKVTCPESCPSSSNAKSTAAVTKEEAVPVSSNLDGGRHEVAMPVSAPASVKATTQPAVQQLALPAKNPDTAGETSPVLDVAMNTALRPEQSASEPSDYSSRPPSCQHLTNDEWEYLQMTAGPDHVAFWWRAAEERREALKELIDENVQVHQQNRQLRDELRRLKTKESEASYYSLMARLWELESSSSDVKAC